MQNNWYLKSQFEKLGSVEVWIVLDFRYFDTAHHLDGNS